MEGGEWAAGLVGRAGPCYLTVQGGGGGKQAVILPLLCELGGLSAPLWASGTTSPLPGAGCIEAPHSSLGLLELASLGLWM